VRSALKQAFIEDHQILTRGLSELIALVEEESYEKASRVARELDAGPHIELEEKAFYPEVRKTRGREYVENLFRRYRAVALASEPITHETGRS
jgi:hypothetical protein